MFIFIFIFSLVCISIYQYAVYGFRAFNLISTWVSHWGIVVIYKLFINCFSWAEGRPNFKQNFAKISIEYLELEYFLKIWSQVRLGSIFVFQTS